VVSLASPRPRPSLVGVAAPLRVGLTCAALAASPGCAKPSLVPFTAELRASYQLTDDDLKKLQFFASRDIVLRRDLSQPAQPAAKGEPREPEVARISQHRLVLVEGRATEEVVVERLTPGVVTEAKPGSLWVSFEPGSAFEFACDRIGGPPPAAPGTPMGPNPFPGNSPSSASASSEPEWLGAFTLATDKNDLVTYAERAYELATEGSRAELLVDSERLDQTAATRKVLPGVRLTAARPAGRLASTTWRTLP
jgi:hypothetical protein